MSAVRIISINSVINQLHNVSLAGHSLSFAVTVLSTVY